ncbi:hypothetical protein [Streptomyces violascens]
MDALRIAEAHPDHQVVSLAVEFEITAPANVLAARHAAHLGLANSRC